MKQDKLRFPIRADMKPHDYKKSGAHLTGSQYKNEGRGASDSIDQTEPWIQVRLVAFGCAIKTGSPRRKNH